MFSPMTKLIIFPIPIPIPAVLYGVLFLVYTSYAGRKANDGINHDAHFYGALAGVIITIALFPQAISIFIDSVAGSVS
jgi:membrane associated rhomboid family serine protease